MSGRGAELRHARERAGLGLEEVAQRTRIPRRYLEALEREDHAALPPGPYLKGYLKQYRKFLSLPEVSTAAVELPEEILVPETPQRPGPPPAGPALKLAQRRTLYMLAVGAMSLVVVVLALKVGERLSVEPERPLGEAPDQIVVLRPVERVQARIAADGTTVFEGELVPKSAATAEEVATPPEDIQICAEDCVFEAHDRLEVALANLSLVTVVYNGRSLKPLGAQSRPRRLVFVDETDVGG